MALRIVKVGEPWPQHRERNLIELWKVDDDAGGTVAVNTLAAIPCGNKVPIGATGVSATFNTSTKVLSVACPAVAAGGWALIEVIFQPGPP